MQRIETGSDFCDVVMDRIRQSGTVAQASGCTDLRRQRRLARPWARAAIAATVLLAGAARVAATLYVVLSA